MTVSGSASAYSGDTASRVNALSEFQKFERILLILALLLVFYLKLMMIHLVCMTSRGETLPPPLCNLSSPVTFALWHLSVCVSPTNETCPLYIVSC